MQQFKVGLEIHGYIDIPQKLFCNCPIDHNAPANTTICPVCTGQPGAKPMATNVQAVQKAIHIAQVLGCTVNKQLIFQRKHYSWPDSPNNYQRTISGTYAFPVGQQGMFEHIRITQCHLEEDPARWDPNTGQVDYNRCGYPLIEIVTEPDFTSLEQIRVWLEDLVTALSYIKAINKQAGIKCDVNVSIAPDYTRVEVKNVHSFSGILQAVQYEVNRLQQEGIETQHTRMWSDEQQKTIFMRSKEDAADYMFISEPDLPTIHVQEKWLLPSIPKLPSQQRAYLTGLNIKQEDAAVIAQSPYLLNICLHLIEKGISPTLSVKWVRREIVRVANFHALDIDTLSIAPQQFYDILHLIQEQNITDQTGQKLMELVFDGLQDIPSYVKDNNLIMQNDTQTLQTYAQQAIADSTKAVEDYKQGNENALNYIVGQVMRKTKGTAKPDTIKELLKKLLQE